MSAATDEPRGVYTRVTGAHYLSISPSKFDDLAREGLIETFLPFGYERGRLATKAALDNYIERLKSGMRPSLEAVEGLAS